MMLPSVCKMLALLVISCVVLEEGFGHPLSGQQDPPAQTAQTHRVRTKRCSCNSWLDKECIYFCHLDIIWVNTPSKILPYGLGSPLSRRRRSAERCGCASRADAGCSDFCRNSSEKPRTDAAPNPLEILGILAGKNHMNNRDNRKLLTSLRSVVRSNTAIARRAGSSDRLKSGSGK